MKKILQISMISMILGGRGIEFQPLTQGFSQRIYKRFIYYTNRMKELDNLIVNQTYRHDIYNPQKCES